MEKKSRKSLIALVLLLLVGVVGGTIAYFTSTANFENVFKTQPYGVTVKETFLAPKDWTPGTTTEKKVVVTNTSDIEVVARVSFEEKWYDESGAELADAVYTPDATAAAIINFTENSGWVKVDGDAHYYYNKVLAKNDVSSSFIESVTFNKDVVADSTCKYSDDLLTYTCTSTGKGYDNATYKLTITVDTLQEDASEEVWGVTVANNAVTKYTPAA